MASSSSSSENKKMIRLKSSDRKEFVVDETVAVQSQTIRHMIEDDCIDNEIPLPNVDADTLSKIIEYCKKHVESAAADDLKSWDAEFMKVDRDVLYHLILAANYLNIKELLGLACQTVADMIKSKTPDEIRKIFNIENDLSPEEEEEIRRENPWAFE